MPLPKIPSHVRRKISKIWEGFVFYLTYPLYLVSNFSRTIGSTFVQWLENRHFRYLLQGLPALVAFIGIVVIANFAIFQDRLLLANNYKDKAVGSMVEAAQYKQLKKDPKPSLLMAQTCYQRLATLNPGDSAENRYGYAITLGELDQMPSTDAVMRDLAPLDKSGYGPAHLWQGQRLWAAVSPMISPDGKVAPQAGPLMTQAEQHFLRALQWKTGNTALQANMSLAQLYSVQNKQMLAEEHLSKVAEVRPELRLTLAQMARSTGRFELAQQHARAATVPYRGRLYTNPDDHAARFALVECDMLLNDFTDARQTLEKGRALASSPDLIREYLRAMCRVLLANFDAKAADSKSNSAERYALLEEAMNVDPDNPELLQRLISFTQADNPEGEKARAIFKNLVVEGKNSAIAHLFLGIDAFQKGNVKEARYYWEKAYDMSQGAPLVSNNLAWVLAHYPPVDLPKAYEMIQAAIEKAPKDPRMHGTRGHILAKMNKPKEALADLELAKAAYPNDPELFRMLSETCEKLGYTQQAADYAERSKELMKKFGKRPGMPDAGTANDPEPAKPMPEPAKPMPEPAKDKPATEPAKPMTPPAPVPAKSDLPKPAAPGQ